MSDHSLRDTYSYFVNSMLFLFALFVNIHNTIADIALFGLFMAGVYVLKKNNLNLFKDSRLRILLFITAGYYFINVVIFFINGTNFSKYLQTDIYFLLAVFIAASILHAKVNMSLFLSGIRLALLFLGLCHFLSLDYTNIYISIFAPITVLMMFLSVVSYDHDNLINKILGLIAFVSGLIIIIDSSVRLSWVVFIVLIIVVSFIMLKKIVLSELSRMMVLLVFGLLIYFIINNTAILDNSLMFDRIIRVFSEISNWSSGKNLDTAVGVRLEMYTAGLEAFKEKPFFGHGFRNATKEASKFSELSLHNYNQLHNEYITTMVEKGLFGMLSLGILLLSPILIIARSYSTDDIYIRIGIITIISFILFGVFNVSFGDTTFKAFYVLLICLFLPNIFKEKV